MGVKGGNNLLRAHCGEWPSVSLPHVAVEQWKHVRFTNPDIRTCSASVQRHTHWQTCTVTSCLPLLSTSVLFLFALLPFVILKWEKGIKPNSLTLHYTTLQSFIPASNWSRFKHNTYMSFLVPSQFACDCSTFWSGPIYSRLQPPPPCSLKVTPGDFGRGVLKLLCQCEALQWQGCWWGWSLWSRTAPFPTLTHKGCILQRHRS